MRQHRQLALSFGSINLLRQVIVADSDFHMSDRAIIILPIRPVLTIEQLEITWIAEGVDHI